MRKIHTFITIHLRENFKLLPYASVFVFLSLAILVNYTFDFEDTFLETQTGFLKLLFYYLFYSSAYYGTLLISHIGKENTFWKKRSFWIKSNVALVLLSVDSSVPYLDNFINNMLHPQLHYWIYKVMVNLISFVTVFIPLLIFYYSTEKNSKHVYGLNLNKFDSKPYFIILALLLPLIIAASFHPTFLHQYPMYKTSAAHTYLGISEWVTVAGYELAYSLDFITVEFLFRGFMVIGMISVLNRGAILPMAVTYCFLHFGKPPGEAISSVFGGYALGIIAYETRSVWGGIIVHVGIALMMEIVAFVQKSLN